MVEIHQSGFAMRKTKRLSVFLTLFVAYYTVCETRHRVCVVVVGGWPTLDRRLFVALSACKFGIFDCNLSKRRDCDLPV